MKARKSDYELKGHINRYRGEAYGIEEVFVHYMRTPRWPLMFGVLIDKDVFDYTLDAYRLDIMEK